jgi:3-isopropylmalate/(R)-2-methylmalate dehydratase small subunit
MIKKTYKGQVWKFGDNISTDSIAPGRLMHLRSKPTEYAKYIFETTKPEFAKQIKKGDFIVAGDNFGCGSSREIAPIIIKLSGVAAILAKSFGRIFYRNAINNGMMLIQCDTDAIEEGDVISINTDKNEITKFKDRIFKVTYRLEDIEKRIIGEGGLLRYIEKHHSLDLL